MSESERLLGLGLSKIILHFGWKKKKYKAPLRAGKYHKLLNTFSDSFIYNQMVFKYTIIE
jgi:hypothetical protein